MAALQRALIELGYELPRWGADGDLGTETMAAMVRVLADHGRSFDEDGDEIPSGDIGFVLELRDALRKESARPDSLVDLRAQADRSCVTHRRAWPAVTGICLHQTACVLGERPARWASIGAHVGVTRGGKVIWLHDFDVAVVHGNGFNGSTVGIEMDGTYAGVEGDDRTFWRPAHEPNRRAQTPTPELIAAARQAVRWICAEVARHGGAVKLLVAHRQSSKERQSDPGSALWQAVALPLHAELGLTDGGPGYVVGSGLRIPEAWDASRKGVRY